MSRNQTIRILATLALAGTSAFAGTGAAVAVTPAEPAPAENLQADIATAQAATNTYWATHWNEFFDGSYTPPTVVGLYDGTNPATAPVCGGQPLGPGNAYYCPEGDYVAWDAGLMTNGYQSGDAWPYLVVAHEWGHAIQNRLPQSLITPAPELQADCLAGAALFGAAADGTLVFEDGDQQELVAALSALADQTPWTKSGDHGDALERVNAFSSGRQGGVEACLPQEQ
ncbi:neutral zinc metallopeptidase [Arthrobacter sp. I2-34]|uniref:Neutral zinc metallopeptidase n=1 Tax=Arthrobacter hankyongi TaxID=2904801 RepID=A0ABS9L5Z6_9MICC|nr:neutral zinc metallopeptidase [Arthrobacter hankyongi]MCG2622096.1 neutral zinc metallopeptidase [Arthrobacter hankyongi]